MGDAPRRPKGERGNTQDKLWQWALGVYFDYHDEKKKLGGFPHEFQLLLQSKAKFAPGIDAPELLAELLKQYGQSIWHIDPVRRPAEDEEGTDDDDDDDETVRAKPASSDDAPRKKKAELPDKEEHDLFTVAGIVVPPSFTVPDANVPGGFRRVIRRWGTTRIWHMHAGIVRFKANQAVEAADREADHVARVIAAIGQGRLDRLLWDLRDGKVQPPPRAGDRPHR